jgi:hypothetical protein
MGRGSAGAVLSCAFGAGVAVGTLVSSGLVACEAPPTPHLEHSSSSSSPSLSSSSSSSSFPVSFVAAVHTQGAHADGTVRAVHLSVLPAAAAAGAGSGPGPGTSYPYYYYLPAAGVSTLEPSTGSVHGGTRLRVHLEGGGGGSRARSGGLGAAACRFGPIVVSASSLSRGGSGGGGGEGGGGVLCLAPAGRPGWTDVAVGSRGAACDSAGAGFAPGASGGARPKYRYHSLD